MQPQTVLDLSCGSCGAALKVWRFSLTTTCPYCASNSVIERPASRDRPDPVFVLPFVLDQTSALDCVRRWIGKRGIFAHGGLARAAPEQTHGVYLPVYLFGAVANSGYSAEIGEYYTVTTGSGKNRRTERRTEWRDFQGQHSCYVRDVLVTASQGFNNNWIQGLEPFDYRALRRYQPALLSGWIAEEPSVEHDKAQELAREESYAEVRSRLAQFMPGDKHRNLRTRIRLDQESLDLIYVPVWTLAVRYRADRKPLRIAVNGQTGEVVGRVPLSTVKISIAVIVAFVIAGLVSLLVWSTGAW